MEKSYDANFKTKVAIEAIREEETLGALSGKYGVHANCISEWKQAAIESINERFSKSSKKKKEEEITRDDLLKEVGQLRMKSEFLKNNTKRY